MESIPWPKIGAGANAMQASSDDLRRAHVADLMNGKSVAAEPAGEHTPNVAEAFGFGGGFGGGNFGANRNAVDGGFVQDVGYMGHDTRRDGDIFGRGMENSMQGISDNSKSFVYADQYSQMADVYVHNLQIDPSVWVGESGLFPYVLTDKNAITFNTYTFDADYLDDVPERGTSRFLTYTRKSESFTWHRKGKSLGGTMDFYNSPQGRKILFEQLRQTLNTIQQSAALDVMWTILEATGVHATWRERAMASGSDAEILRVLTNDRDNFDCAKLSMGLQGLVARNLQAVRHEGGDADTLLISSAMSHHQAFKSEAWNKASNAGDATAAATRSDWKGSMQASLQAGMNLLIVEALAIDRQEPRDPMRHALQIGEYYMGVNTMRGHPDSYETLHTALALYNEHDDTLSRVHPAEALRNCLVFDDTAEGFQVDDNRIQPLEDIYNDDDIGTPQERMNRVPGSIYDTRGVLYPSMASILLGSAAKDSLVLEDCARTFARAYEARDNGAFAPVAAANAFRLANNQFQGEQAYIAERFAAGDVAMAALGGQYVANGVPNAADIVARDAAYAVFDAAPAPAGTLAPGVGGAIPAPVLADADADLVAEMNTMLDVYANEALPAADRLFDPQAGEVLADRTTAHRDALRRMTPPAIWPTIERYSQLPFTRRTLQTLMSRNVVLPIAFKYARLIDVTADSAVLVKKGSSTGITYVKKPVWAKSSDGANQTYLASMTIESKAVLRNAKNVFRSDGVYSHGAIGGSAITPIVVTQEQTQLFNPRVGVWGSTHILPPDHETAGAADPLRPALFTFMVFSSEVDVPGALKNPLSLHGQLSGPSFDNIRTIKDQQLAATRGFSTLLFYERLFSFSTTIDGVVSSNSLSGYENMDTYKPTTPVLWRGACYRYNMVTKAFDVYAPGTSPLDKFPTVLGVDRVRAGTVPPRALGHVI